MTATHASVTRETDKISRRWIRSIKYSGFWCHMENQIMAAMFPGKPLSAITEEVIMSSFRFTSSQRRLSPAFSILVPCLVYSSTLKKEVVCSSETSINFTILYTAISKILKYLSDSKLMSAEMVASVIY